jgi:hypothetical protein
MVKEEKEEALAHHVLINILLCDALERNPVRASLGIFYHHEKRGGDTHPFMHQR